MTDQSKQPKGEEAWITEIPKAKKYGDYLMVLECEKLGYSLERIAKDLHTTVGHLKHLKQIFEEKGEA